jgi:hypothetical protein
MSNSTNQSLTDEQQAFMKSFKDTHGQYDIPDEVIVDFLNGHDESFDGYTQLADAYNLWRDAINFAKEMK